MNEKIELIRQLAYYIWEREGRPPDRELQHWLEAESAVGKDELRGSKRKSAKRSTGKSTATRATATKKSTAPSKTKKKTAKKATKRGKKKS